MTKSKRQETTTAQLNMNEILSSSSRHKKVLYTPPNFGQVEEYIYRSALPTPIHYPFLKSLSLKTVIALSIEHIDQKFLSFLQDESIEIVCTGGSNVEGIISTGTSEEMVTEALRILLNPDSLPAMVMSLHGTSLTGVVVGCLRKLRKWSMISIFEEYRRFCGTKVQQEYEQFIELFDNDLVHLPISSPVTTPK